MLLQFRLHYLFVLTLFFVACDKTPKETTINGVVLDKITGEPIAGASVAIRIYHNSIQIPYSYEYVTTDQNGKFNFHSNEQLQIYDVTKPGFIPRNSGIPIIKQEELNDVEILVTPIDGVLRLKINNSTIDPETIFLGVYSPNLDKENFLSYGFALKDSLILDPIDMQFRILNLASEDSIGIYWGFTSLPFDIKTLPFHEYVSVTRNDTTTFTISI
ncbi:MAG: carboxypeptidase regulatory-like domain-containing protein [Chitinophagales bacterium]|nr:carboxypeptidase regulatory-like domain-containing protein [Chitinophagales bacterium]